MFSNIVDYHGLKYSITNENLEAILFGLDFQKKDKVLSIGGSGDLAFLILPLVNSVEICDISEKQINFMNQRYKFLKKQTYEKFLNPIEKGACSKNKNKKRTEIFKRIKLLEIEKNIEKFKLYKKPESIFKFIKKNPHKFNKIYLSNSITYGFTPNIKRYFENLEIISSNSKNGTLIYVSDFYFNQINLEKLNLKIEENLSQIAKKYNNNKKLWNPTIFRKIN